MARRFNTHNRFAEELDGTPSRLNELTAHTLDGHAVRAAGWRRNLAYAALTIVAVTFAMFAAR